MDIGETDDPEAVIQSYEAEAAVTKGDPVYLSSDHKVSPAAAAQNCIGIAAKTTNVADQCPVIVRGRVKVKAGGVINRGRAVYAADNSKRVLELTDQAINEAGAGSLQHLLQPQTRNRIGNHRRSRRLPLHTTQVNSMKPRLFESLMQQNNEFKEHVETQKHKVNTHPFLKRYCEIGLKEGLFSDSIAALGRLHDTLIQSAGPEMIGRDIITVMPTTEPMERFPLDTSAVAYRYAEGAATRLSGAKNGIVDIYTNILAEASEEWTREFLEDATWNVMNSMVDKVGRALGEDETSRIIALYGSIADADLAGGDNLDQSGKVMDWDAVVNLHNTVRSEDWKSTVLAINETQLHHSLATTNSSTPNTSPRDKQTLTTQPSPASWVCKSKPAL